MNSEPQISFGYSVRVRTTPLTEERGLAGQIGQVCGETTPSVTNIKIVGEIREDFAVADMFEGSSEVYWLAVELLEFIDLAAGTEIELRGVPKKWVRTETGEWVETSSGKGGRTKRRWWKFW